MRRIFTGLMVLLVALTLVSCGLLPSSKGPNYKLMEKLEENPNKVLSTAEKSEFRGRWKREVGITESFSLGRYSVTAYPLTPAYANRMGLDLPKGASCFHVILQVRSPYRKKVLLPAWEGVAEDHVGRAYRLRWLPDSYHRNPVSEDLPGSSSGDKLWHQSGTICSSARVTFDRYFKFQLNLRRPSFPFYGAGAEFVWNIPQVKKTEQGEEVKVQREKEVERYRGW